MAAININEALPPEIILSILDWISPYELWSSVAAVCKSWADYNKYAARTRSHTFAIRFLEEAMNKHHLSSVIRLMQNNGILVYHGEQMAIWLIENFKTDELPLDNRIFTLNRLAAIKAAAQFSSDDDFPKFISGIKQSSSYFINICQGAILGDNLDRLNKYIDYLDTSKWSLLYYYAIEFEKRKAVIWLYQQRAHWSANDDDLAKVISEDRRIAESLCKTGSIEFVKWFDDNISRRNFLKVIHGVYFIYSMIHKNKPLNEMIYLIDEHLNEIPTLCQFIITTQRDDIASYLLKCKSISGEVYSHCVIYLICYGKYKMAKIAIEFLKKDERMKSNQEFTLIISKIYKIKIAQLLSKNGYNVNVYADHISHISYASPKQIYNTRRLEAFIKANSVILNGATPWSALKLKEVPRQLKSLI